MVELYATRVVGHMLLFFSVYMYTLDFGPSMIFKCQTEVMSFQEDVLHSKCTVKMAANRYKDLNNPVSPILQKAVAPNYKYEQRFR